MHNDLTNCLRHGDLTIPTRLAGPGRVDIAEIKAGGNIKLMQRSRLDEKLAFLNAGYRPPADDADSGERILTPAPRLRTYHSQLRDAIAAARRVGYADFSAHPCMTVAIADYRRLDETPEQADDWAGKAPRRRGWDPSDPRVIQSVAFVRRLRERRNSFPFIAPYAIYPLEPVDIADLILGHLDICTTINCDELERTMASVGLHSQVASGADADALFLRASDGANTVSLPAVIREQVSTELMSPGTVIAAIRHSLAATAGDSSIRPARHLVPYAGESAVWLARGRVDAHAG